jgi:ATP-dependent Lon protease
MSQDDSKSSKKNIKHRLRKNPPKRKQPPPPPEDDEDEEMIMLDIADILSATLGKPKQEENENEKYLKSLSKGKRRRLEKEEKKILDMNKITKPLRYKILESNLSTKIKSIVLEKVDQYENSNPGSSGFSKLKNYMDTLLKIPFGVYNSLPVTKYDSPQKISGFLTNVKKSFDSCIYGQETAKLRLMEVVAKWITNPKSTGNVIGLCGPPGVGKTTLIKNGLSNAVDVPFAFMPMGGCTNSSILEGHDYTYEGSKNGKIVDILIENKCMNPIIFFDEVDKLGESFGGKDISGVLTHITDFTQNDSFNDRYFSDIEFDLSKCLFIFSFNDINKLNPILRDRITVINMNGFDKTEKLKIAKNFATPKISNTIGLCNLDYEIPDTVYKHIIENYCSEEKGIRKLEKCIESLLMRINIFKLTRDPSYLEGMNLDDSKIKLDKDIASKILNKIFNVNEAASLMLQMMYT